MSNKRKHLGRRPIPAAKRRQHMVATYVDAGRRERIEREAQKRGITISTMVQLLIDRGLEKL